MITDAKLGITIKLATIFITKAKLAKLRINENNGKYKYVGTKETASCKRASMDLSRALTELRKG